MAIRRPVCEISRCRCASSFMAHVLSGSLHDKLFFFFFLHGQRDLLPRSTETHRSRCLRKKGYQFVIAEFNFTGKKIISINLSSPQARSSGLQGPILRIRGPILDARPNPGSSRLRRTLDFGLRSLRFGSRGLKLGSRD